MGRKRVEGEMSEMEAIRIDTTPVEQLQEVPKAVIQENQEESSATKTKAAGNEPINCLRNERIMVKFVPSPNAMVQGKGHVLSGGMAENATRSFVVPRLSTGIYKNVLTDNEKTFLEMAMGLEPNALSIYKKRDNFWDDSNPEGIGKVVLRKYGNYLNLNVPEDYIRYKILLANKDYICPSMQELDERPKATYQFVIVSENAETQMNLSRMDATKRCYMEYGKVETDRDTLRTVIEILEGRPTSSQIKLDYLQGKINDYIQKDPRRFLGIIKDELLPAKVLVKKATEAGLITRRNDLYYYEGTPMCEMGEDSTLNNAAKYVSNIKRQELKYSLEAKLKE